MKSFEELGIDRSKYETSFVFLWGFNHEGNPYLDMLAHGAEEIASSAVYLSMRERFQSDLRFGHIRAEGGLTKQDIQNYVDSAKLDDGLRREVIAKLKSAGLSHERGRGDPKPSTPVAKPETFIDALRDL